MSLENTIFRPFRSETAITCYAIRCADRLVARCHFVLSCFDFRSFRASIGKMTSGRRGYQSTNSPYTSARILESHESLADSDVRGICFRGNPDRSVIRSGSVKHVQKLSDHRSVIIFLLTFTSVANSNAQIAALGASSTAGHSVGRQAAYPAQLEEILRAKGRPMTVINAGISGDTAGGMLARLSGAVPPGTKIVILQIAGNDMKKGLNLDVARANRAEIRRQLRARGVRIIEADQIVQAAKRSSMGPDGIHLTAEGQRRIAEQIAPLIH
jgi:acyl-CoA thioesterase-1